MRACIFGEHCRRDRPHWSDLAQARQFLAAGADVELCRAVFEAQCRKAQAAGKAPPDTLRWMAPDITAAVAAPRSDAGPAISGNPEARRWRSRIRCYLERGLWLPQWGFPPNDPSTVVPKRVLAEMQAQLAALPLAA